MCGIAGATRDLLGAGPEGVLKRMGDAVLHRGPDMGGVSFDGEVGLCHRRLSIIDLCDAGRQPMDSADGRFTIVFNGEIYNFQELKEGLASKGRRFRTRTDTEVLLYLYAEHGPASLDMIRGMFAYAIWDRAEKRLFAARDRIGKKPFYYYHKNGSFAFASEIKSLLEIGEIKDTAGIDPTSVIDYLKYLYVPHPKSIYMEIQKLEPGHYLTYRGGRLDIHKYWDIDFSEPFDKGEDDLKDELLHIITGAVQCRLISDVPVGAFLSGGVDSSAVAALMARSKAEPIVTCTIGFEDKAHNEAQYAKEFAESLNAEHHEFYVRDEPAAVARKLVWHFDEPFADSSMVPTYYVSKMARQNVTVAVSGDGGDESFAGYEKYGIDRHEDMVRRYAPHALLEGISRLAPQAHSGPLKKLNSLCRSAVLSPADSFYVTNSFISDDLMRALLSDWMQKAVAGYNPDHHIKRYYEAANGRDHLSKILYTDLKQYLPGDILVKVDRMSMANSLEVRSPLLDHKVIEFAARIPSGMKIRRGEKKYLLKKAFEQTVGKDVLRRKKHGFDAPVDGWFRGELKKMSEETIFDNALMGEFFNMGAVRRLWDDHVLRNISRGKTLWSLFVFSLWLERFRPGKPAG